jgi:hypothetical protein
MARRTYVVEVPEGIDQESVDYLPPPKVFLARSFDGGLTFPEIQILHEGIGVGVPAAGFVWHEGADKPWIETSGHEAMLVWTKMSLPGVIDGPDAYTTHVVARRSTDDGATWSPTEIIAGPTHEIAYPARASDGTWVVKMLRLESAVQTILEGAVHAKIAVARETSDGWTMATGAETKFSGSSNWAAAVVNQGGHDVVLVPHGAPTSDGIDVVVEVSQDAGATWDEPLFVDHLPPGSVSAGNVASSADGTVYIVYLAWSDDAAPHGADWGRYDVRVVAVRDGVVSAPLVLEDGLDGSPWYRGHYLGIAPSGDGVGVVWTGGAADALTHRYAKVQLG